MIGALPNDVIASSPRPLELAVRQTLGTWPAYLVSTAAVCASIGVLNGWILMAGRIPFSAAQDGLFFSAFARIHPRFATPYIALIVGCVITSIMLTLYFIPGSTLLSVFNFTVLLANLGTLFPYLYNSAAALMLARRDRERFTVREQSRTSLLALACFAFLNVDDVGCRRDDRVLGIPGAPARHPALHLVQDAAAGSRLGGCFPERSPFSNSLKPYKKMTKMR